MVGDLVVLKKHHEFARTMQLFDQSIAEVDLPSCCRASNELQAGLIEGTPMRDLTFTLDRQWIDQLRRNR
jgi:hypothetical protein